MKLPLPPVLHAPALPVPPGIRPAAATPLAQVRNLAIGFRDEQGQVRPVVKGVSFQVHAGEVLGIVGESGSGKSLSVRSLVGLNPTGTAVQADALELDGQDLRFLAEKQWRRLRGRRVGLVLQDALVSLDPLRSIGDEVREALTAHTRLDARTAKEKVLALLRAVGIADAELRARQYSHELSGGLRQRALIASAIAADPALIIADEPTTALDAAVQLQILDLLRARVDAGAGLIIISHDMGVIQRIADRVVVMRHGEIVESGPTRQVLSAPQHPYTRQLLRAIPSGDSRGYRLTLTASAKHTGDADLPVPLPARQHRSHGDIVLSVKHVWKSYRQGDGSTRQVARDITFDIHAGETVGLVGESGSGKSTVGRIIMGILPPDQGEVLLDGQPWSTLPEKQRRSRRTTLQTITQDTLGVFDPRYTVAQSLQETLVESRRLDKHAVHAEISRLLDAVGLSARKLDQPLRNLSGGERQRVAIARALATRPRLIVCDEPVSALDISVQAQVLDLLWDLQAEFGLAYLFISHDLGVVHHLSDHVLVMRHGQILERGSADDIFHHPRHPYVIDLVNAVPRHPLTRVAA
ncbi:dipeptide ABC transporter ATP-binding protein [Kerstersia similis]|uniref:dipeptide ABC transporter ATP-binding protein n=1 Tax=Kerstersia similis TaxID=206505 RepID=UPI0039EFE13E